MLAETDRSTSTRSPSSSRSCRSSSPSTTTSCRSSIRLLKTDRVLKKQKVLIFTEFADTARYLRQQLEDAGIDGRRRGRQRVEDEPRDRRSGGSRPTTTASSSAEIAEHGEQRDPRPHLHRRALRRPEPPGRLAADQLRHPLEPGAPHAAHRPRGPAHEPGDRGAARCRPSGAGGRPRQGGFWNFLPPDELNALLTPLRRGDPEDPADLEDPRHRGQEAPHARGRLRGPAGSSTTPTRAPRPPSRRCTSSTRQLLSDDPELGGTAAMPCPAASSAASSARPRATDGVFFCYALPALGQGDAGGVQPMPGPRTGTTRWYLYDLDRDDDPRGARENRRQHPLASPTRRARRGIEEETLVGRPRQGREAHQEHLPEAGGCAGRRQADRSSAGWN